MQRDLSITVKLTPVAVAVVSEKDYRLASVDNQRGVLPVHLHAPCRHSRKSGG